MVKSYTHVITSGISGWQDSFEGLGPPPGPLPNVIVVSSLENISKLVCTVSGCL